MSALYPDLYFPCNFRKLLSLQYILRCADVYYIPGNLETFQDHLIYSYSTCCKLIGDYPGFPMEKIYKYDNLDNTEKSTANLFWANSSQEISACFGISWPYHILRSLGHCISVFLGMTISIFRGNANPAARGADASH